MISRRNSNDNTSILSDRLSSSSRSVSPSSIVSRMSGGSVTSRGSSPTCSVSSRRTRRSPSPPARSVETSRPVSPMTLKQWNSLQSHMQDMIEVRLGRTDEGTCTCSNGGKMHLHMAMAFEDTGSHIVPLSFGQNMARDKVSYHAEHNAIMKLKNRDTKKLMPINIFVLKTSITGLIGMSKPCAHCLAIMSTLPQKKGYRIANVLYTNSDGNIEKKKLSELMTEELHFSKLYIERNYKPKFKTDFKIEVRPEIMVSI